MPDPEAQSNADASLVSFEFMPMGLGLTVDLFATGTAVSGTGPAEFESLAESGPVPTSKL